ncbi:MAG: class I SAM-dependent methyltransferase [Promethearchaeota archaeon]|nr:MAG: class I SAM-dependent methyltransferase [Candidatus Lokiarchaeota archaeon]
MDCNENSPFNQYAKKYDSWYDTKGKLIFKIELLAIKSILKGLPTPWVEIGVGSGRFAQALGIPEGLDPSIELLKIAKSRGITVHLGKGENLNFPDFSYGTVFLIVTLCFLPFPEIVFREIYRILKSEGKLLIAVVLSNSPWGIYYRKLKTQGHPFYKRATFYTYNEIIELSQKSGFSVENTISTLFQEPNSVKNIEYHRTGYYPEAGFTILILKKNS